MDNFFLHYWTHRDDTRPFTEFSAMRVLIRGGDLRAAPWQEANSSPYFRV
jgi:hypothetical protein